MRRLNVRTRLMAVITVPLVLLLAVTVPQIMDRRGRAAAAERGAELSQGVQAVAAFTDSVQAERTLAGAARAGADDVTPALTGQRRVTDGLVDRTSEALADLAERDPSLAEVTTNGQQAIGELDDIRRASDASLAVVPWVDPFEPVIGSLLDVEEAVGAAASEAGLGSDLAAVALLSRAKEATAQQAALLAAASAWTELRGDQVGTLAAARADETGYLTAAIETSPFDARDDHREELGTGALTDVGREVDAVTRGTPVATLGGLDSWLDQSALRQQALRRIEGQRAEEAVAAAQDLGEAARRASTGFLVLALVGLLIASALALLVSRSITRPLRKLTDAADHLAEERLPQLVDALRHPAEDDEHYLAAALEPIELKSSDELGRLATAFNAVQAVAVDVAAEQANLLRKGISDLYVNLARRNQSLLDRQIHLLDQLETGEQDPETLEHLYLLDHLATRMRRNAESLLVLAGAESGPRRTKAVGVVDVVRAALSEVEEYERIDLGTLAPAVLHGPAVSDVAHLVAELLENATHFSPPETQVRIDGIRTGGSYQLVITDRGVGMREGQLEELNAVLRDPPVTGLALGRSLGCLVAARLAARHDITVRLRPGEHEGLAAYVILPRHLLVEEAPEPLTVTPDTTITLPTTVYAPPAVPVAPAAEVSGLADLTPVRLRDALPGREEFDAGLQALLARETAPAAIVEPPTDEGVEDVGPETAGALRRRVPGATAEAVPDVPEDTGTRRSPDEVRALLTSYRTGLQAGRSDGTTGETS